MDAIVILCTAPAEGDAAAQLARALVEERLAACVNVIPGLRSFYRWQGKLEEDTEVQLVIKTRRDHFAAVEAWLKEHHPYDEPEVLALPVIDGSAGYLAWLAEQTER
ncbi:MAG TPA: divalent-cation tolerance protein CutA [Polyangiaceae bacterium]|nr:divalent-cation tolerance protein CutA [Polyangiaceae bacterium]HMR75788.1 divalent-cation tolerance protein CutA [Polyangiaceae bacterium]